MNHHLIIFALLFFSSLYSAFGKGFNVEHLFGVGGGIAHPSFIGGNNPVGFIYNTGGTFLLSASTNSSGSNGNPSPLYYSAGIAGGKSKVGGGIFASGVDDRDPQTSSSTTISWGLGAGLFDALGIGISGTSSSLGRVGLLFNYEGHNRFGITIDPPTSTFNSTTYGLGYAYSSGKAAVAIDATYTTSTKSGTLYAGLGIYIESFQMVANYAHPYVTSGPSTASGTVGLGAGISLGSSFHLALAYSTSSGTALTSGTYGATILYTF